MIPLLESRHACIHQGFGGEVVSSWCWIEDLLCSPCLVRLWRSGGFSCPHCVREGVSVDDYARSCRCPHGYCLKKAPHGMCPDWSLESESTEIEESQGESAASKVAHLGVSEVAGLDLW